MPSPSLPPIRPLGQGATDTAPIPWQEAALGWLAAWFVGQLVASAIIAASGIEKVSEAGPGWLLAGSLAQWTPMVVVLVVLGRRHGVGNPVADFGIRWKAVDLVGIPLGVLTQLVLVRGLYWPLEQIWPGTFTRDALEQRARDLYDNASGAGVVALVFVVVIGAPLVEEMVYRGLLQGSLHRCLQDGLALVLAAAWFATIHFQAKEWPGLFLAGLVFGACMWRTGRLGMSILTHLAFNATGLLVVATS